MVRIKRSYRIQVCDARSAPKGELPLGLSVGHAMRAARRPSFKKPHLAGHPPFACSGVKALRNTSAARRQYHAWLDSLPASLEGSRLAEKLNTIVEFDLEELQAIDLPRGYGRD